MKKTSVKKKESRKNSKPIRKVKAQTKPWQKGYDLTYLKDLQSKFQEWNNHSLSPFSQIKKNNIAEALSKGELIINENSMVKSKVSKAGSTIYYVPGVAIAEKAKGDRTIEAFVSFGPGGLDEVAHTIRSFKEENKWAYVWAENAEYCALLELLGFTQIGSKITSYGEVYAIYFKGKNIISTVVHAAETQNLVKLFNEDKKMIESIRSKLDNLDMGFTNHYSNYNKGKSWSAISLRGYSPDPAFITKPSEMNAAWLKEHAGEDFKLQNTKLRKQFPEVDKLLERFGDSKIHRIRFMKLAPGNGELERHTDQVDEDSGVKDGKLVRLHWPIKTNPKVIFNSWGDYGEKISAHMEAGTCWYLDTRKPHAAGNFGDEERIHLVVDIESNPEIRSMIVDGERA